MKKKLFALATSLIALQSYAEPTGPMEGYYPTIVSTQEAQRLFEGLRTEDTSSSICSNRAMVWSYEMKQQDNIDSMKLFMHYSDIYRHVLYNDGKHKATNIFAYWWRKATKDLIWYYHVAPSVMTDEGIYTLDPEFLDKAVTSQEWLDHFTGKVEKYLENPNKRRKLISRLKENIRNDHKNKDLDLRALKLIQQSRNSDGSYTVKCDQITHIMENDFDAEKGSMKWCHYQYSNMYYWTPGSLRLLNNNTTNRLSRRTYSTIGEEYGRNHIKTDFMLHAVEKSYSQAFSIFLDLD